MADTRDSSRSSRTPWILTAVSVSALVTVATVVVAFSSRRETMREVTVPSVISLPASKVQDELKSVDLVAQPKLLGWKSTALPWEPIASQDPQAGTLVAAGSHVQVGIYLAGPGGLEPPKWPTSVPGRQTAQGSYANPAQIGALVTEADQHFEPLVSKSFVGPDGYALATIDGFMYPAATTDAGTTWRVAGLWFAGPWADGAAFPSTIRAFSPDLAVAFQPGEDIFYTTTDGGTTWFTSAFPGGVVRVSGHLQPGSSASSITVTITNSYGARKTATYRTLDSGRTWSLRGQIGVSGDAAVPDLTGMTIAQASGALVARGFVPMIDYLLVTGDSPRVVVGQTPLAGSIAQRGADVAIAVPH